MQHFGYIALFSVTIGIALISLLYTIIFLKDSASIVSPDVKKAMDEEKEKTALKCDTGKTLVCISLLCI